MLKTKIKLLFLLSTVQFVKSTNLRKQVYLQPRIIAGYNCSMEEAAYFVTTFYEMFTMPSCGASLITTRWILTAAHCCRNLGGTFTMPYARVAFGKRRWSTDALQIIAVEKVVKHGEYKNEYDELINDICVVKLKAEAKLSNEVKISKLATTDEYNDMIKNKKCNKSVIMGFGSQVEVVYRWGAADISLYDNYSEHLQCGRVMVRDLNDCEKKLNMSLPDHVLCASDPDSKIPGTDTCQKDSGGPMYCNGLQIGIVSWGRGCGGKYPGIYVRVDKFIDFIENETGPLRERVPSQSIGTARVHLRVLFVVFCIAFTISK